MSEWMHRKEAWVPIHQGTIQPESLVVFYFTRGNYVWGTGNDLERVKKEYPHITHYQVICEAPSL